MKNAFTCYLQYIFWGETLLWATFNPKSLIASELVYIEHQVHFLCNFGSITGASSDENEVTVDLTKARTKKRVNNQLERTAS